MKIIALLENTTNNEELKEKHGLSLYIETKKHKILFDLGPDGTFLKNAEKLNVDISKVDTVVISHGHSDHGGGLKTFLEHNKTAKIYINKNAFEPLYIKVLGIKKYIGLDKSLKDNKKIILVDKTLKIDDELFIFSNVEGQFDTKSNRVLLNEHGKQDEFYHEQNLLITEEKNILLTGCSHRGITNILNTAYKYNEKIDIVIGGFHLYSASNRVTEPVGVLDNLAEELNSRISTFYTCHCTGEKAFNRMKDIMGEQLNYIATGDILNI